MSEAVMSNPVHPVLEARNLCKTFADGASQIRVIDQLNLKVLKGESLAIMGASGSGKSTLLHLLGGLDEPSSGEVLISGKQVSGLSEADLCQIRNSDIGFVYQFHHLLPEFCALENVAMPLLIAGDIALDEVRAIAAQKLKEVGLSHRENHKPGMLSGGERQRVAIARALVNQPQLLLADEPTGNLDHTNAMSVFEMLSALQQEHDLALVLVTHDDSLAKHMGSVKMLQDGGWA